MTAVTIQGPPLALSPAARSTLLQTIIDTMPRAPNASEAERAAQRDAAFELLADLDPRDSVQAMFAVDIIAAHHAGINAYRLAARPDMPPVLAARFNSQARSFTLLKVARLRDLRRLQANAAKPAKAVAPVARAPQPQAAAPSAATQQAAARPRPDTTVAAEQRPADPAPADPVADTEPSLGETKADEVMAEFAARLKAAGLPLAA
jgi:hypothetical protein